MENKRVVHDPQVLRAIAHPVRNRILGELDAQGSLRATDLARELDIPANQASFHLRQLAKYGLVEEDPEAARDKRDRVWRAVDGGDLTINLDDVARAPGGAAAARVFRRNSASWAHLVVEGAYAEERTDGEHRSVASSSLRITADEARELGEELGEVVERWTRRTRGRRAETVPAAETYLYLGMVLPYPGLADDRRDGGEA